MKRINSFDKVYKMCNAMSNIEKLKKLADFPRYIDVELTNFCNFNCLMCPTGTGMIKRKQGFMEKQIFEKIIENIGKGGRFVLFVGVNPRYIKNFMIF